jgi:F0F1-type ATP synthase membrane subunit b/b'
MAQETGKQSAADRVVTPRDANAPAERSASPKVKGPPPLPAPGSAQARTEPKKTASTTPSPAVDGLNGEGGAGERRSARRRPAGPQTSVAANDDVPSIGGLIFALQQKPSKRPLTVAAIASGAWAFITLLLGAAMLVPEIQRAPTFMDMLSRPTAIVLAATLIIPIALFWFLALLLRRAQELRLMSSAMTEVAIRLAEPDRMAEQQIASVGQAVRRQVSFMNEAVSRALGRAGELEALVHKEVATLEASYSENEHRIRSLLSQMSGERESLLHTSERVNIALKEISNEVPALVDKLSEQQHKLTSFIEGTSQNLIALEGSLATVTNNVSGALDGQTEKIETLFKNFAHSLGAALGSRTEDLQTVFEEYVRALDAALESRQQALDTQLVNRTQVLDDAFADRLRLFDDSILRSTIAIDGSVADKTLALTQALEGHAKEISEVLGRQAGNMDEQIMHGVNAVRRASENVTRQSIKAIDGIANQTDLLRNVSENLLAQVSNVTGRFEHQGQMIMKAANALETANFRIDKTLENRQSELSRTLDQLTGRADDVGRAMLGYSESLEGSVSEAEKRVRSVGENISRNVEERSRLTMSELQRLQTQADEDSDRVLEELRAKFTDVSREVSEQIGSLSSRFSTTSEEMRQKARNTLSELEEEQSRLREQLERLPEATRASAETMRTSLQEQLRALEQLSSLSSREAARREISPPAPLPPQSGGRAHASDSRSISVTQNFTQELNNRARENQRQAAATNVSADADDNREGWSLGDLLARASLDDDGGAPGAPLNVQVIARALDATTASAIWSRFRTGQRGIMVRSIYTTDGRTAFDSVQRRYRSEDDFRQTADRYMLDFENLLREADSRDPSGRSAQGYVTSDSGRVYLFLAHASGRLV